LARRCGNDLYLRFLGLLGFPIASLLTFGHLDLPWFDDAYKRNLAATKGDGFRGAYHRARIHATAMEPDYAT
jgi:hypothetical protein